MKFLNWVWVWFVSSWAQRDDLGKISEKKYGEENNI